MSKSKLSSQILDIGASGGTIDRSVHGELIVITKGGKFFIDRVDTIKIMTNYAHEFTNRINIVFSMQLNDLMNYVVKDIENIKGRIMIFKPGGKSVIDVKLNVNIGMDQKELEAFKNSGAKITSTQVVSVTAEGINEDIMRKKDITLDGIYKDMSIDKLLNTAIFGVSSAITDVLSKFGIGNSIMGVDNKRTYEHIVLPTGTKLLALPKVLQELYGVYNGGANIFNNIFDGSTSIFPTHRPNLNIFSDNKLIIYMTSDKTVPGIENTYVLDGSVLKVITFSGDKMKHDQRDVKNTGTKTIVTEADSILRRPLQVYPKNMTIKSENIVRKSQHKKLEGSNKIVDGGITNNSYNVRSKVLENDGHFIMFEWHYSNSFLLKPVMPVTILEEVGGTIKVREGILHQYQSVIDGAAKKEFTSLLVFVKNETKSDSKMDKIF